MVPGRFRSRFQRALRRMLAMASLLGVVAMCGCYAPLRSPGIPAAELPAHFRMPLRTAGDPLNYAHLSAPPAPVYMLGTGDVLEVTAPDLIQRGDARPFRAQVLDTGEIHLPRAGAVHVAGVSLSEARLRINAVLLDGFLEQPAVTVNLVERGTVNVVVLGAVRNPGVHSLQRQESDIAHALAAAGGFAETAGDTIEVHRRSPVYTQQVDSIPATQQVPMPAQTWSAVPYRNGPTPAAIVPQSWTQPVRQQSRTVAPRYVPPAKLDPYGSYRTSFLEAGPFDARPFDADSVTDEVVIRAQSPGHSGRFVQEAQWSGAACNAAPREGVLRISLRDSAAQCLAPHDVMLHSGDVVVVPDRKDEVFYVVGPLSEQSRVRFNVGDRDREIGNGFILPNDREVDVVTAVAMAGYIDPIESPTTVTVHRTDFSGRPLLVRVDLIAARSDPRETILVQPGDIIYLNPDHAWYSRRLFDRVIDRALGTAVGRLLTN